jgi:hypothetical protein
MFIMKSAKISLSLLVLAATLGASAANTKAEDGLISKVPEQEGSYCHLKFPAIRPSTLAAIHPQLKSAQSGDIVDYYGACDHDPRSRDEVISQRHEEEHRWAIDYES